MDGEPLFTVMNHVEVDCPGRYIHMIYGVHSPMGYTVKSRCNNTLFLIQKN